MLCYLSRVASLALRLAEGKRWITRAAMEQLVQEKKVLSSVLESVWRVSL